MAIEAKNLDDAIKSLEITKQRYEDAAIMRLERLGIQCVAMVRDATAEESWNDQTGNLRSSIGYAVVNNGQIVRRSSFATVQNGAEGSALGQTYVRKIASENSRGLVLIVVAGEHYAEEVEAIEGKTVLASAALFAEQQLPRILDKLKRDISL